VDNVDYMDPVDAAPERMGAEYQVAQTDAHRLRAGTSGEIPEFLCDDSDSSCYILR